MKIATGELCSIKDGKYRRSSPNGSMTTSASRSNARRPPDARMHPSQRRRLDFPYRNGFAAYVWVTKPDGRRTRKYVYGKTERLGDSLSR
ncbi:hypothetical protein [Micromonospora sp. NPDC051141]|uniref:hypothetical protein n=1 Tax=Micromonospora sp. NPDC051141 TaxID=3364284 RepID=UPI0037888866